MASSFLYVDANDLFIAPRGKVHLPPSSPSSGNLYGRLTLLYCTLRYLPRRSATISSHDVIPCHIVLRFLVTCESRLSSQYRQGKKLVHIN
eukprot:scaffold1344_cov150-Skeletonema_dohrnii-CCMP3373.AAC.2